MQEIKHPKTGLIPIQIKMNFNLNPLAVEEACRFFNLKLSAVLTKFGLTLWAKSSSRCPLRATCASKELGTIWKRCSECAAHALQKTHFFSFATFQADRLRGGLFVCPVHMGQDTWDFGSHSYYSFTHITNANHIFQNYPQYQCHSYFSKSPILTKTPIFFKIIHIIEICDINNIVF